MIDDTGTLTRGQVMAARDSDPLWPKPESSSTSTTESASAKPERLCEICDANIDGYHGRAKTCHRDECKRELTNRRNRRNREAKQAEAAEASADTSSQPRPESEPQPDPQLESDPQQQAAQDEDGPAPAPPPPANCRANPRLRWQASSEHLPSPIQRTTPRTCRAPMAITCGGSRPPRRRSWRRAQPRGTPYSAAPPLRGGWPQ